MKVAERPLRFIQMKNERIKKLYVDQFSMPSVTTTEYEAEQDELAIKWDKEVGVKSGMVFVVPLFVLIQQIH